MLIADRPAGVGVVVVGEGDGFAAGKEAAQAALAHLGGQAGVLLTIAFMGPEEEILRGIAEVAPGVPVVGGTASDHSPEAKFQQFANGHAYTNHFAIAALGGPIGYAFTNGYRPTGKKATVSKASGRTVFELDGRRAMDVYSEWVAKPESRSAAARSCPSASSTRCSSTRTASRTRPTRSTATPTVRWTSGRP